MKFIEIHSKDILFLQSIQKASGRILQKEQCPLAIVVRECCAPYTGQNSHLTLPQLPTMHPALQCGGARATRYSIQHWPLTWQHVHLGHIISLLVTERSPPPAPPASQLVAPLSCSFNLFVWRLYSKAEGPHASAVLRFGDWREQHGEPLSYSIAHLHAHLQNFLERYSLPPTMNWPESILHLQAYLDRWEETCRYIDRCDHNTVQFLQGTNTSISSLCSLSWLHATLYPRCDD